MYRITEYLNAFYHGYPTLFWAACATAATLVLPFLLLLFRSTEWLARFWFSLSKPSLYVVYYAIVGLLKGQAWAFNKLLPETHWLRRFFSHKDPMDIICYTMGTAMIGGLIAIIVMGLTGNLPNNP